MKQLQYRNCRSIGETPTAANEWKVYAEATIVTKEMRAKLRELDTFNRDEHGVYEYRVIDTKHNVITHKGAQS